MKKGPIGLSFFIYNSCGESACNNHITRILHFRVLIVLRTLISKAFEKRPPFIAIVVLLVKIAPLLTI